MLKKTVTAIISKNSKLYFNPIQTLHLAKTLNNFTSNQAMITKRSDFS